jgi:PAS domain S-box-containing protein
MAELRSVDLADNAPIMIWASGPDAACCYFNRGWLQFTGRALEQELGAGWLEGVHPEDSEGCMRDYLVAFEKRQPFTLEYRLRRHDGEYRWIFDVGVPRHGDDGAFHGYVGCVLDVSEQKRVETALRQSHARLRAMAANLQAVREEERTRIAREIHDQLGRALTRLKKDVGRDAGEDALGRQIDDMLHTVRRIATELRPVQPESVPHNALSERERQILCMIGGGSGPREIAAQLQVTINTVGTYRARVLRKLGMRNNAELVRYALEHKLMS